MIITSKGKQYEYSTFDMKRKRHIKEINKGVKKSFNTILSFNISINDINDINSSIIHEVTKNNIIVFTKDRISHINHHENQEPKQKTNIVYLLKFKYNLQFDQNNDQNIKKLWFQYNS